MKKPKRGRPKLPASERREMFAVRITKEERAAIEQAAGLAGVSVSEWARRVLVLASTVG